MKLPTLLLLLLAVSTDINLMLQRGFIVFLGQTQSRLLFKILKLNRKKSQNNFRLDPYFTSHALHLLLLNDTYAIPYLLAFDRVGFNLNFPQPMNKKTTTSAIQDKVRFSLPTSIVIPLDRMLLLLFDPFTSLL
jgi:hypothetical protein